MPTQSWPYSAIASPPRRSSELWKDPSVEHPDRVDARDLDLVLFNDSDDAWGAHVAIIMGPEPGTSALKKVGQRSGPGPTLLAGPATDT